MQEFLPIAARPEKTSRHHTAVGGASKAGPRGRGRSKGGAREPVGAALGR